MNPLPRHNGSGCDGRFERSLVVLSASTAEEGMSASLTDLILAGKPFYGMDLHRSGIRLTNGNVYHFSSP